MNKCAVDHLFAFKIREKYFLNLAYLTVFYFNFNIFIYLFLERGRGREKEGERNVSVWLPLAHSLLGT